MGKKISKEDRAVEMSLRNDLVTWLALTSSRETDESFFNKLARHLAQCLGMDFVCIDSLEGNGLTARTLAVWCDDHFEDNITYTLKDTPCADVVGKKVCCFPATVCQLFPEDQVLQELRAESYVGVTLWSRAGTPIGLIAVISRHPLVNHQQTETLMELVAERASAELERLIADEKLKASEEYLHFFFEYAPAALAMFDNEMRYLCVSQRWRSDYRLGDRNLLGLSHYDVFPEITERWKEAHRRGLAGEVIRVEMDRFERADGSVQWLCWEIRPWYKLDGIAGGIVIFTEDITSRKGTEEALRKSENEFRMLAESMPQIVWVCDPEGLNTYFNQRWVDYTGLSLEESAGHGWDKPFHPDDLQRAWNSWKNALINSATYTLECRLRRADGAYKWWLIRGVPVSNPEGAVLKWFGTCTDIDELKKAEVEKLALEQKFQQTQKLESLGVLAGGIAHDFNNILMTILGNADLALMRLSKEAPAVENLQNIEKAAARAADLSKQMLAYSGKGKFVVENLNLNSLLEEMLHMLEVSISKKAVLRFNFAPHLPSVAVDATQVRQIVMNLVINASEAIGDKSGVICISSGCISCDKNYLKDVWLNENIHEGLYVFLEIADTGCGMNKETLARIFEPFFTTKFTGRGLGMAAVLGIVRGHKGAIKVYSEQGKGTTFKILLPASDRPADLFNNVSHTTDWQGSGTVLLVDDEETVRAIGSAMLKELGFAPITANDGREAISMFRETPGIAFVILDLTMPHMDGEQCFRELRQIQPDVKVIMTSGYNEQEVTQKFVGKGLAAFIQKPYKLSLLKEVIRRIVEAK